MKSQALLAELYRQTGRSSEAYRIEEELRVLLSAADPDHPILKQLEKAGVS